MTLCLQAIVPFAGLRLWCVYEIYLATQWKKIPCCSAECFEPGCGHLAVSQAGLVQRLQVGFRAEGLEF